MKAYAHLSDERIAEGIASITKDMKGPLTNFERRLAHEERKDLREEQARRAKETK